MARRARQVCPELEEVSSYTLEWPKGVPRTPSAERRASRYQLTYKEAEAALYQELRRDGVRPSEVVISSNHGVLSSGNDPGVAVYYWSKEHGTKCIPCDSWATSRENLRAIGVTIECLRRIALSGSKAVSDHVYDAFKVLPGSGEDITLVWPAILGVSREGLTKEVLEAAYKRLVFEHHPDRGGSSARLAKINLAYAEAINFLDYWRSNRE